MFCLKYIDPITNWLGLEEILGEISIWSIMVRFILAFLCSGLIGMERARRRRTAPGWRAGRCAGPRAALSFFVFRFNRNGKS